MTSKFCIVGGTSSVLYELDFLSKPDLARASTFVLHAALDMVDLAVWSTPSTYLKVVDRHNDQLVSAYVTPGGARFLVLHDARNEDGIRSFCNEAHEVRGFARARSRVAAAAAALTHTRALPPHTQLYTKLLLNPFYTPGTRIESADFDGRVRGLARRYLGVEARAN